MSPPRVLEQIARARVAQQKAGAELAALVDRAVELGIGWPQIAAQLGVTRQAARQHYQRRHRDGAIRQDRLVKRQVALVNMCCRRSSPARATAVARLTSENPAHCGLDNGCCPIW